MDLMPIFAQLCKRPGLRLTHIPPGSLQVASFCVHVVSVMQSFFIILNDHVNFYHRSEIPIRANNLEKYLI